jgi:hypothetical protein
MAGYDGAITPTPAHRLAARRSRAKPIADALRTWLDA